MFESSETTVLEDVETHTGEPIPAGSAILRAIRIIDMIARRDSPPQLAEICRQVGLPKPTVYRILSTLEHAGWICREPGSKRYTCASDLTSVAGEVLMRSPSRVTRRAILEELVEQTGESCNLSIPNVSSVLYLDRVESDWPLRTHLAAGSRLPLHASASGKLFLSAMPRRSRERTLRLVPLVGHTPKTITDPARLLRELEEVRQLGYATDHEEYLTGICCLAVPVRDEESRVVAALSVHAPLARTRLEDMIEMLPMLRQSAEALAQTIDW